MYGTVRAAPLRARVSRFMSFGYIGYIWSLCGCASLVLVALGGAGALYAWARRTRAVEPTTHVEKIGLGGPPDGGSAA